MLSQPSLNKNKKVGVFDIETNGLLDTVTQIWCCVVKDITTGNTFVWDRAEPDRLIRELDTYDVLIGHNCIAYDFPVLRKVFGYEYSGKKVDTLVMSRTQRPNRKAPKQSKAGPHSVEAWGLRFGRQKIANEEWGIYHPAILDRCKEDVEIQYRIYLALLEEGRGEGWGMAHRLNMKLFDLLQRQEAYGWTVDVGHLDRCITTLNRWISRIDGAVARHLPLVVEKLETFKEGEWSYVKKPFLRTGLPTSAVRNTFGDDCVGQVGGPFSRVSVRTVDLDSNKEVKEFLINEGWQPAEWNLADDGSKRSPKLSKDDPFEGIQGGLGRLISRRVQCKHRLSTLEGWRSLIRPDGRVSTPIGGIASTGRLRHNEIVNVPSPHSRAFFAKQMRQVFVAKDGWKLVGVDSKGNQVRQLAARMGDEEFTKAVLFGTQEDGTDLHSLNQRRSGAPSRSKAKNFFYGFIFGARAPKIATTIGITVAAAKVLIETYLNELPKLRQLIERLTNEWRKTAQRYYSGRRGEWVYSNGKITGLDGRPIWIDSEHKILCYMLQSDEAIQMAAAYVKFHADMAKAGYVLHEDYGTLIWMHDEIQFETRPEIAEAAARICCEAIAWAGRFYKIACPHEGSYLIGNNWYETH